MNTCACMYVDYAWTYVPKHTCSCNEYGQAGYVSMGNLVSMLVDIYIFVYVTVYVFMCRHVYVYLYDCFM